jgi:hypothetical protein
MFYAGFPQLRIRICMNPHPFGKLIRIRIIGSEKGQDPDPHQSKKEEAFHFGALEGPKVVSGRIRIRIELKGRMRIRNTGFTRILRAP